MQEARRRQNNVSIKGGRLVQGVSRATCFKERMECLISLVGRWMSVCIKGASLPVGICKRYIDTLIVYSTNTYIHTLGTYYIVVAWFSYELLVTSDAL